MSGVLVGRHEQDARELLQDEVEMSAWLRPGVTVQPGTSELIRVSERPALGGGAVRRAIRAAPPQRVLDYGRVRLARAIAEIPNAREFRRGTTRQRSGRARQPSEGDAAPLTAPLINTASV